MRARKASQRRGEDSARPLLLSIDLQAGRITAAGELDRAVAHRLGDALDAPALTGNRAWTVDAAGLTFCDAEGLRSEVPRTELPYSLHLGCRLMYEQKMNVRTDR